MTFLDSLAVLSLAAPFLPQLQLALACIASGICLAVLGALRDESKGGASLDRTAEEIENWDADLILERQNDRLRHCFRPLPLFTSKAAEIMVLIEDHVEELGQAQLVLAHIPLERVVAPTDISKNTTHIQEDLAIERIDIAIFSYDGFLQLAIDMQIHAADTALTERDKLKEWTLAKIDVPLLRIGPNYDPAFLRADLTTLLQRKKAKSRQVAA